MNKLDPNFLKVVDLIKTMPVQPERTRIKPITGERMYRNKRQHVVGYYWSRMGSGMSGMTYDNILGAGDSFAAAFERAEKKIAALKAKT